MAMFYFRFEALPSSSDDSGCGGAFINCWIQRETREQAESFARSCIADQGWRIARLEEAGIVTRDTQTDQSMQYFEQAELDGEVFVFHNWPITAHNHGTSTV